MALVDCRDVSLAYDGKVVIDGVNFTLNEGDYLAIVGENGSGKSTLMKGILNLKRPDNGTIILGDGLKADEIGYLPQQSDLKKHFPASVYEVVLSGRLNQMKFRPFYNKEDKKQALEKMDWMGITNFRNRSFEELSGGQQQRVLLARALCATKKVLLLDEPVAGLDPVVTRELYELIETINTKYHISIMMISHDIKEIVNYATHILHLGKRQLFFGTLEEYKTSSYGIRFLGGESND